MNFESPLPQVLTQLGIGVIFLWLYWEERKERKQTNKEKDDLNEKVLEAFNKNSLSIERMNKSIDKNIEATSNLSDIVVAALKRN